VEFNRPQGQFAGPPVAKSRLRCGGQERLAQTVVPDLSISNACLKFGAPQCSRIQLDRDCRNVYKELSE
jgi:hypothetical protein